MSNYINPDKRKLESKGIESGRSQVHNLIDYAPHKNIEDFKESIINNFLNLHSKIEFDYHSVTEADMGNISEVVKLYDEIYSIDYIYGETPEFNHRMDECSYGDMILKVLQ